MKFTSQLIAAASGSIGGATFSRNRGGQYIRRRALPSNPNTEAQTIARTNLATAVAAWTNVLDDTFRQGWATYAEATPITDALGNQIKLSGQQMYIRSATVALIAGLALPTISPTESGLGLTPDWDTDPVVDVTTQDIVGPASTATPDATRSYLVYMSRPVVASRSPAHETQRFAQAFADDGTGPTTITVPTPFPVIAGQKVRVRLQAIDDQYRVSAASSRDVIVVS